MKMISKLLKLSFRYCGEKKITINSLSVYIFNNSSTLSRLKNGGSITVRNYERAIEWLSDHWPEDKKWPDFIERPTKR